MNSIYRCAFIILIFCFAEYSLISAQRPGQNPSLNPDFPSIGSTTIEDTLDSGVLPLDTPVAMTYILIEDPDHFYYIADTFIWEDNRHFPLYFYQSHLGNLGSPSRPLVPAINLNNGFATGWDQYDPYYASIDSFRYYNQSVPVAKIKYSQASQEDTYLSLQFGRSFARGLNLSFTYDRINQGDGIPYQFPHQRHKNTALALGVWHNSPGGRYDAFYNFISNGIVGEENGGVSAPELIGDSLHPNAATIPVFISEGITTHKHRLFYSKQILHLNTDTSELGIDLWVQGHFKTGLYKYADPQDTLEYYGSIFNVDMRGIRHYTFQNEFQVAGGMSLPWRAARSTISSSLRFRSINLEQEPVERKINELYWDASGHFHWIEPLELKGEMSLGLGQASGAYVFNAEGILHTGILGKFSGNWSIVTRNPHMVESTLYVMQQLVYHNDFLNPFTTEIGVGWNWEEQNFVAGIKWLVFDNYIFFNSSRIPQQLENSFSLRQFHAAKKFDFKWIGLQGNIFWQPDAKEELAIPEVIYTAGFYGRINLFKRKLTVMPGLDFTYHDGFDGLSYFPVTGRFHLTDGPAIPEYFRVDAAIGIHINFLKAFARIEDIAGFFNDRVLYEADYYPHYPGYFRLGIETSFFN